MAQFFVFLPSVLQVCLLENILSKKNQTSKYIYTYVRVLKKNWRKFNKKNADTKSQQRKLLQKQLQKKYLKFKLITTK